MGKLKIAFVLDDTLDTPDGVQQYVLTLGEWLAEQGHEIHYLVGRTIRTDIPNVHSLGKNVRVKFNGNRMSTPLPASRRKIKQLLEKELFDILHVQIPYSPFLAGRIVAAAPRTTAVVGTFHVAPNSSSVELGNKLLGLTLKRSLRRFNSIMSVSPAAVEFARQTYGIESTVLPNVVKASHFKNASAYVFKPVKPTIVFLGRLVPRKGCQILLEAVHRLLSDNKIPSFRVVICGRGELENQLKSYANQHHMDDTVQFVGFVDNDQKASYLRAADLAVFPSTGGESFGIVLLEAMAAEHPVVLGANNDGYKTVLGPHPDLLFPLGDPIALADKIKEFITKEEARSQAVDWQKKYIRQFDVANVGTRLIARYQEALRSSHNS